MTVKTYQSQALPHESGALHVSGSAQYIDDLPEINGTLHAAVHLSPHAHAQITDIDLSAVQSADGVVCTLTAADLTHCNDIGPVLPGDALLADGTVEYAGQVVFAVAATTRENARQACQLGKISYTPLPAVLSIEQAIEQKNYIIEQADFHHIKNGDATAGLATAPHTLSGSIRTGGQEHFYLEGQVAYAVPQENGGMLIYSSTQHPSEIQILAAKVLGVARHAVTVQVRRMGGGFGGKETQAAQTAILAAVLAQKSGAPTKLRLSRGDDFKSTGKRHPTHQSYQVGFDDNGRITAAELTIATDCGISPDLSLAITDRAMFHADNCYHYPQVAIVGVPCKTNTASNTAFRGFGGPQGMLLAERIIQDIAAHLNLDPLIVRQRNLYNNSDRQQTPYGQLITDNTIGNIVTQLAEQSDYLARRQQINAFNQNSPVLKKGIALTPVKFGISFTTTFLNQAGALLTIYADGSVLINHGGTEMGQGLFTKVQQVVAHELGLPTTAVRVCATATDKVPNTSPTAASSGADMNCMAALRAVQTVRQRLIDYIAEQHHCPAEQIRFADGNIYIADTALMTFSELARQAHLARISLSATGFYRTPTIHYDKTTGRGHPFYYYAYGAAVSETIIDKLTGEYKLTRVDILHDVGNSINPAIDIGQIEGGFAQGMGWLTSEELVWGGDGNLLVTGPSTYKIPAASDLPDNWHVNLYTHPNTSDTIYRSKAVGEPPLMLGISVWAALEDAASNAIGQPVRLDTPVTPERLLMAMQSATAAS